MLTQHNRKRLVCHQTTLSCCVELVGVWSGDETMHRLAGTSVSRVAGKIQEAFANKLLK